MAYQMVATAVTLNDLKGHSSLADVFKCNPSNISAAFCTISTDSVLAWFLCISRASGFCHASNAEKFEHRHVVMKNFATEFRNCSGKGSFTPKYLIFIFGVHFRGARSSLGLQSYGEHEHCALQIQSKARDDCTSSDVFERLIVFEIQASGAKSPLISGTL